MSKGDSLMGKPNTTALQAARCLIRIAEADGDPLTHLRLQKLLYYVQGWSLAVRNRPIFGDRIEAWSWGPVVPRVWRKFKQYGDTHIISSQDEPAAQNLSEKDRSFIGRVWDAYKEFSAFKLSDMTHQEPPWRDAREGLPDSSPSTAEISLGAMRTYFRECANAKH